MPARSPADQKTSAKIRKALGQRIREARHARRITLDDMSDKVRATRSNIHAWEAGQHFPSPDRIVRLAGLFEVSTDWLLGLQATTVDDEEAELVEIYRSLAKERRDALHVVARAMREPAGQKA